LLVAVKQAPYGRPFVRYIHVGHSRSEARVDDRAGLPGEGPGRRQDHLDISDGFRQRGRVAGIDGTHLHTCAIGGQRLGEVLKRAAAPSCQSEGEPAGDQLGRDEPSAVPGRAKQQHIGDHLTIASF
jgi:hypothetical protein